MERFVSDVLIQATSVPDYSWGMACTYWNWIFWIGFVAGLLGAIVSLFLKSPESM